MALELLKTNVSYVDKRCEAQIWFDHEAFKDIIERLGLFNATCTKWHQFDDEHHKAMHQFFNINVFVHVF